MAIRRGHLAQSPANSPRVDYLLYYIIDGMRWNFFLFLTFEAAYIPKDPADFTWSFDMIRETLAKSGFTKWSIIINTSLTAIGSWFAVAED